MNFQHQFASSWTSPQEREKHFATSLVQWFRSQKQSPVEYLQDLFAHIENTNPLCNALTSLQKDSALQQAQKLLKTKMAAQELPLYGVPIILKENIQKIDFPLECGSRLLKGYKGQFNATAVHLLERAGAIFIGTANMDEFAMGSSNEHSCHGPVKNPHDLKKVSGGSSGGSAAACAAGYAPLSLGSDTGGSVREPAAFCGIYGFKPSYGRISRYGLVAYGSSLDQIAPFSRSVCDLDLILRLLGQPDAQDPKTLHTPYVSQKHSTDLFKNTTLGVFRSLLKTGIDSNVLEEFYALEDALQKRGVTIKDLSMPSSLEHALSVYYIIASAEASSNLARFDGIRYGQRAAGTKDLFDLYCKTRGEGFGPEVKRRIMMGTFALSAGHYNAYYGRAQMVRNLMQQEFDEIFKSVDFIYSPTAPSSAFDLGSNGCDSLKEYLYDIFTIPANLTGSPAISMPALLQKSSPKKLPVGLQLMAGREQDAALIAFAAALEKENLVQTTPFI